MTPVSSGMAEEDFKSEPKSTDKINQATVPWPGGTYIIRDRKSKLQITLVEGLVRLEPHLGDQGGYHWHCVSEKGWLGFRNPTSGMYLGHDNKGDIVANQPHHLTWESFVTRAHPDGGQILLTKHDDDLLEVSNMGGYKIGEIKDNGTVWEFLKV